MSTRLAVKEFIEGVNISVRRSSDFKGATLHGHDFYELDIVCGGSARTNLNGKNYDISSGCVSFLSPEDFHEYFDADNLDIYNVQFSEEVVSNGVLRPLIDEQSRLFVLEGAEFARICKMFLILEELYDLREENAEIMRRMLECILMSLYGSRGGASERRYKDIQKALVYIHAHFKDNPPLDEVAGVLKLNERYFCSKFKEYVGCNYKTYLRNMKLRYSRRLLLATELSVIDIAAMSGYNTQSHFNREFKSFYGESPLSVRKGAGK